MIARTFEEFYSNSERPTQKDFVGNVKDWQGEQKYPKRMHVKRISGNTVNVACNDPECTMVVVGRRKANLVWTVDQRACIPEHNNICANAGNLQPKILASVMLKNDHVMQGSSKDAIQFLRTKLNCSVGGDSTGGTDITSSARMGVHRARKAAKQMEAGGYTTKIQQIEDLLRIYQNLNKGSFTGVEFHENGTLRRLFIIPQTSVSVWKSGFARPLISLDGGFWKEAFGMKYKLIIFVCTTGNNNNQTLVWIIADGETGENISYGIKALEKAGIIVNDHMVATISDEGSGIWKAFRDNLEKSFHMLCIKHWKDNSKGWGRGNLFNDVVSATTQASYDAAIKVAEEQNPEALKKLLAVTPTASLVRFHRLQLQIEGEVPATCGRTMSYSEQEQSKYRGERKHHPTDSIVHFSNHASVDYAKQIEDINKIRRKDNHIGFLTPYAHKHYEDTMKLAQQVMIRITNFEEGLFCTYTDSKRVHRTNFLTRQCSDCHLYMETLMPCHHLVAIYMRYKTVSNEHHKLFTSVNDMGVKQYIHTSSDAQAHLYGRCYWMSTMSTAFLCAPVVPVSYDEAASTTMAARTLIKPTPKMGRTRTKRIQSAWDTHGKGTKPPAKIAKVQHDITGSPDSTSSTEEEQQAAEGLMSFVSKWFK
jgi:hypothetical protein